MATRTINSPGVEVRETDLSLIAPQNVGTNVFITGFANSGPTDEVIKITNREELDAVYGQPTNSAEKYFYYGIKELLTSPANIYTYRLPYGADSGLGFGSLYSALAYPVIAVDTNGNTTTLSGLSTGTYFLGAPIHLDLTQTEYNSLVDGDITWSGVSSTTALSSFTSIGQAGIIVLNKSQTTINPQFEGYYVGIADNSNINPNSPHNSIIGIKTVSVSGDITQSRYTDVPTGTLQFNLSSPVGNSSSVSQVLENLTSYNIDGREDDDVLSIGVFKIRKSIYANEAFKLDYIVDSAIVGSIDYHRQQLNPTGGPSVSFFLESRDDGDRNVQILVNPHISNRYGNTSLSSNGIPSKKIRVTTNALTSLTSNALSSTIGTTIPTLSTLGTRGLTAADNLYALGSYSDTRLSTKSLGSIPTKLQRALDSVVNDEIYDIDIVVEAGLGTIHTAVSGVSSANYDDTVRLPNLSAIQTSSELDENGRNIRSRYTTIFNLFENFCNLPSNSGGRGDCLFIADVLRHSLVNGNTKVLSDKSRSFQQFAYWPMRHQFSNCNTSYATVYTNWSKFYDDFTGDYIWVPFSPVAAASIARSDAAEFPWSAPAGYTRGLIGGYTVDLAITPNQKQRDELYKANLNPVLWSPSQGMAIYGQKTLLKKPSAFDRINVRRLFFALERPSKKASIFFVFEPNDEFTRTRLINTLDPIFRYAKNNRGIYDYELVCDERNNTPDVIDSNELRFSAYIKPTRTGEYIILNFVATRTDANFEELI